MTTWCSWGAECAISNGGEDLLIGSRPVHSIHFEIRHWNKDKRKLYINNIRLGDKKNISEKGYQISRHRQTTKENQMTG